MNWDWDKLQERRQRQPGPSKAQKHDYTPPEGEGPVQPGNRGFDVLRGVRLPPIKLILALVFVIWLLTGIFIVEPDEAGVVLRFGEYNRTVDYGPHYHLPFPIETVYTPKVKQVQRIEIGFRSGDAQMSGASRNPASDEASMLTGDENIVNVQFIVQFVIKDPVDYLFRVYDPYNTVKNASEAAIREVMGYNKIDSALTDGRTQIENDTRLLLQDIMNRYSAGVQIIAVQMQDVHPPKDVSDAFKDVASAREDRVKYINEAEAYRNDILPKARGRAAEVVNAAEAYRRSVIETAQGESSRFLSIVKEYNKAPDITVKRMYLETMQTVLSNPALEKIIMPENGAAPILPYLPLDRIKPPTLPTPPAGSAPSPRSGE